MSGESPSKQHQQQEVTGQELSQPVSTSSSAASSPSSVSALSLPSLVRSQSVPVPLPAPAQLVENVQSPMALHAIMSAPVSYAPPSTPPQYFASVRVQQQQQQQQQQLPSLTSEYAEYRYESAARSVNEPGFTRRPSLPPLSQFVDSQNLHQFPTSHPYRLPMQRRVPSDPPPPPLPRPAPSSSASSTSREPGQQLARSTSVGGATRPKSHVIAACSNCKKAHLACDGMSAFVFS
ncbi:hypothetical protein POJ06DRAFT_1733 [Lipomyces tetrasporus]|uniref:Uncharacterized protein n=1 Tax=Lipomyces tetrasporus TaxID=54092 RepID=A0AAD7VVZ2_9ASCO|nr:uncharacterized protein POJ06DRAFT_1733 [Lipomyces tetrasporus]KAJ8103479.1 hypothetical protein POJ06DRAFT_1733 [Lipomyces tetrasporus]